MYYNESEAWAKERAEVAARQARCERRNQRLAEIGDMPRRSQRIAALIIHFFTH